MAINAGAKHFSEKHKNIFYDSDRFVKDWLNKHAADFITNINAETRQAIKFILAYGQDNGMSVKELAKIIRLTIGLNQRQAAANLNYRNSVKEKLLQNNPRMSQAKAEQKAQAAALKYASKQHRQRAEMIAHTELAFGYNRGAHESVRQAMSNGLTGRCEKVWTTAGTNRVCGRCMDLSGTVVGFEDKFFNSSVTDGLTPPLHPRCRCVIVYREIDSPRGKNPLQTGVSSGSMSDTKKPKWSEKNKDNVMTKNEYRKLCELAESNGIALSGVKNFDGSPYVISELILTATALKSRFPDVSNERYKLTLAMDRNMNADDFAITRGRVINFNENAFRDTKRLQEEYKKLVDEGWFVKGTDYRAIIHHEFGHVIAETYKIDSIKVA